MESVTTLTPSRTSLSDIDKPVMHVKVTQNRFFSFSKGCVGGGGGCRDTHCISVDRDVPIKGILFQRLSGTVLCFISKHLGGDLTVFVWKKGSCLLEGVDNYDVHVHVFTCIINGSQSCLGPDSCCYIPTHFYIECPPITGNLPFLLYVKILWVYITRN